MISQLFVTCIMFLLSSAVVGKIMDKQDEKKSHRANGD
jgi:hypothetical protein